MDEKRLLQNLCATFETVLFAFPRLYIVESGFSHVHCLLSKRRNILNIKRQDLRLKLTNLQRDLLSN